MINIRIRNRNMILNKSSIYIFDLNTSYIVVAHITHNFPIYLYIYIYIYYLLKLNIVCHLLTLPLR